MYATWCALSASDASPSAPAPASYNAAGVSPAVLSDTPLALHSSRNLRSNVAQVSLTHARSH